MRHTFLALSTAAVVAFGSAVSGPRSAHGMTVAPGLGDLSQSINPIEKSGCWRYGWHGWGWYPFCGFYGPGPYWGGPFWHHGWGPGWHRHWRR